MKKIDYSKRGPLIKVQIGPGRFVKMYERDAIARGLVKKERPQVENKMMVPDGEKIPLTPDPLPKGEGDSPSPLTLNPPGAAHPAGSSSPGEEMGEGEKKGKRKRKPEAPHPDLLPSGAAHHSGTSSQGEGDSPSPQPSPQGEGEFRGRGWKEGEEEKGRSSGP